MNFPFSFFFFWSVLKVTNTYYVLYVNGSCDVHGVRTTTVRDVAKMYCKEQYMENVPSFSTQEPGNEVKTDGANAACTASYTMLNDMVQFRVLCALKP